MLGERALLAYIRAMVETVAQGYRLASRDQQLRGPEVEAALSAALEVLEAVALALLAVLVMAGLVR